ncbi:hypothetical protein AB0K12_12410 [Nonomuraea sp. NPDC049419]
MPGTYFSAPPADVAAALAGELGLPPMPNLSCPSPPSGSWAPRTRWRPR